MKHRARRGQGAVEYLFNYMWAVMIVMVIGIAMWRMGVFSSQTATTFTGFTKIKPQATGTGMLKNGAFTGTFMNGVGLPINAIRVESMQNINDKIPCVSPTVSPTQVTKGQHFKLTATGCIVGTHEPDEIWEVEIKLTYVLNMGGAEINSTESGRIRGPYK